MIKRTKGITRGMIVRDLLLKIPVTDRQPAKVKSFLFEICMSDANNELVPEGTSVDTCRIFFLSRYDYYSRGYRDAKRKYWRELDLPSPRQDKKGRSLEKLHRCEFSPLIDAHELSVL